MEKIKINQINHSFWKIDTDDPILIGNLIRYYKKYVPGYKFTKPYKFGIWDGKIPFFDHKNLTLPIGLIDNLKEYFQKNNIEFEIIPFEKDNYNYSEDDIFNFIKKRNLKINGLPLEDNIKSFQIDAVLGALKHQKLAIQIPTSGGKTLVIYLLIRFLLEEIKLNKILFLTKKTIIEQFFKECEMIDPNWNVENYISKIYSEIKERDLNKPVILTTWQSEHNYKEIMPKFECVIVDEAHSAKANILSKILQNAINAKYKVGFSGTYFNKSDFSDYFGIIANFGEICVYSDYELLKKEGMISDFNINVIELKHSSESVNQLLTLNYNQPPEVAYQNEVKFLMANKDRNKFLVKLARSFDKNSIFLFTYIDHGNYLKKLFEKYTDKMIYYIDGNVKLDEREDIRQTIENTNNNILLASYGTFSEGVNIKNVHNIVFVSSYKSKVKVLQSIGRVLRKLEQKNAQIFDITDNLSNERFKNFTYIHSFERRRLYKENDLKFQVLKINLEEV